MANPHPHQHPWLGPRETQARLEDWLAMVASGYTLTEMGQKYGVTRQRVNQILNNAGVHLNELRAVERVERAEAAANAVLPCRSCGETYVRKNYWDHYRAGSHRFQAKGHKRTPQAMARDAAMAADYENGMSLKDIQTKYGLSHANRVYRALRWAGLEPTRLRTGRRNQTGSDQLREWIIADWKSETLLNQEIAAKYGVSTAWVAIVMRRAGLTPSRGEAQRRKRRILAKR